MCGKRLVRNSALRDHDSKFVKTNSLTVKRTVQHLHSMLTTGKTRKRNHDLHTGSSSATHSNGGINDPLLRCSRETVIEYSLALIDPITELTNARILKSYPPPVSQRGNIQAGNVGNPTPRVGGAGSKECPRICISIQDIK